MELIDGLGFVFPGHHGEPHGHLDADRLARRAMAPLTSAKSLAFQTQNLVETRERRSYAAFKTNSELER
jgi:hypothetical protein